MFAVGEDGELPGDLGKHDPKLIEAVCNEVGTRIHVWIGSCATGVFSSHTWSTACQSVLLSKDCVGAGVWFCYNRCVAIGMGLPFSLGYNAWQGRMAAMSGLPPMHVERPLHLVSCRSSLHTAPGANTMPNWCIWHRPY